MPAAMTRDVKMRLMLESFVDSLLNDLADECGRAAKALASGIDIFEDDYTEDSEPKKPAFTKPTDLISEKTSSRGPYRKSLKRLKEERL
jgi:hypothetical protein